MCQAIASRVTTAEPASIPRPAAGKLGGALWQDSIKAKRGGGGGRSKGKEGRGAKKACTPHGARSQEPERVHCVSCACIPNKGSCTAASTQRRNRTGGCARQEG
jgi:hypothetical protein